MKNCKRLLSLLLALVMVFSLFPTSAFAAEQPGTSAPAETVNVYFSISHDADFLTGMDGNAVALAKLAVPYFDLANYGLENFYFQTESYKPSSLKPENADPAVYTGKVTALHLMIYATEVLCLGVAPKEAGQGYLKTQNLMAENFQPQGTPGSLYVSKLWGLNGNLNYYVQHAFPQAGPGFGSTLDQKLLHDGDVVTVGHFSDFMFFQDERAPFNHIEVNGTADRLTLEPADAAALQVIHDGGGVSGDSTTYKNIDYAVDVYGADAASVLAGNVTTWTQVGTTDAAGALSGMTAAEIAEKIGSNDVILAVPGQTGKTVNAIVCAPAAFRLTVEQDNSADLAAAQAVEDQIAALPAEITVEQKQAIEDARKAYDALSDSQKALVTNLDTLEKAELTLRQLTAVSLDINLSYEKDNFYLILPGTQNVSAALSDTYGYVDQVTDSVSALDAMIKVHEVLLADAFTPATCQDYLVVAETGFLSKIMGESTAAFGFVVNGLVPNDGVVNPAYGSCTAYTLNQTSLNANDAIAFFHYNPDGYYGEIYARFFSGDQHITELRMAAGLEQKLFVKGYSIMYEGCNEVIKWKPIKDMPVCTLSTEGEAAGTLVPVPDVITDSEDGSFILEFSQPGTYYLAVTSDPDMLTYIIPQVLKIVVEEPNEGDKLVMGVRDQIAALPEPITADDFDAVKAAQTAFDGLTKAQKSLVPNADKLEMAGQALAQFRQPAQVDAYWPSFRGFDNNMGTVDAETPRFPAAVNVKWSKKLGSGWAAAPSHMIIVDNSLVVMVGRNIYKMSLTDGTVLAQGSLVAGIGFGIVTPTYGNGMIFCPLSNGRIQAFDANTLESLWVFQDKLKGQANSPITYSDGMIYTGFWNNETRDANYVAINVLDENPARTDEAKTAVWTKTAKGGYYWAGSVVVGDAVIFGTDDGSSGCTGTGTHLYALNRKTGEVISDLTGEIVGDQRSTVAYSAEKGRVYFTTKGGYLYSAAVDATTGALSDLKGVKLTSNQSTSTPVVYGNQVYLCCGAGVGGGDAANNFTVCDADTLEQLYVVGMQGYPQCSPLLSTAYMETEGKLYFYLTYNNRPGGVTLIKVDPTKTTADGAEKIELYDAKGFEQYCICSMICDQNGDLYYKNDSCNIIALGKDTTLPHFEDVKPGYWAEADIYEAVKRGIFSGMNETSFAPKAPMTRAMFVTVLGSMEGINEADYQGTSFDDVRSGLWYAPYIQWAKETGIAAGLTDTTFAPDVPVTREEMAEFLYRYATYKKISMDTTQPDVVFEDADQIHSYFADAVNAMVNAGLMVGRTETTFAPRVTAQRAEAASLLVGFARYVEFWENVS